MRKLLGPAFAALVFLMFHASPAAADPPCGAINCLSGQQCYNTTPKMCGPPGQIACGDRLCGRGQDCVSLPGGGHTCRVGPPQGTLCGASVCPSTKQCYTLKSGKVCGDPGKTPCDTQLCTPPGEVCMAPDIGFGRCVPPGSKPCGANICKPNQTCQRFFQGQPIVPRCSP